MRHLRWVRMDSTHVGLLSFLSILRRWLPHFFFFFLRISAQFYAHRQPPRACFALEEQQELLLSRTNHLLERVWRGGEAGAQEILSSKNKIWRFGTPENNSPGQPQKLVGS